MYSNLLCLLCFLPRNVSEVAQFVAVVIGHHQELLWGRPCFPSVSRVDRDTILWFSGFVSATFSGVSIFVA